MKTKLLLLLLLANFSIYAQTNLVPNGGFENWTGGTPDNWNVSNTVTLSSDAASGQYSAKLSFTTVSAKIIAQVPMKAGITYTVKYKYKYLSSNYSGLHPISLQISKDGSATSTSSSAFASNNSWTPKETTFTPDMDLSYDLSISMFSFDSETFDILIDDVQVYTDAVSEEYTQIPDLAFENKLIALGIDSGAPDGQVLTSKVAAVTQLDLENSNISDLTGIQAFVSLDNLYLRKNNLTTIDLSKNPKLTYLNVGSNKLSSLNLSDNPLLESVDCQRNNLTSIDISHNPKLTYFNCMVNQISGLDVSVNTLLEDLAVSSNQLTSLNIDKNLSLKTLNCGNNQITSLNVSKNTALTSLACHYNKITSLNVSNNTLLEELMCHFNELTSLDVSNNPELYMLDCLNNKITSLNVSANPKIIEVACENNSLTYLNLKNGNNVNFDLFFSNFVNNPDLKCILVDDAAYSDQNWADKKDAGAVYAASCTLGVNESVLSQAVLYPNPVKDVINIQNVNLEKAAVYNVLGQLIKSFTLNSTNTDNTINLSGLPKGVYYIYLINGDAASAKKVVIE